MPRETPTSRLVGSAAEYFVLCPQGQSRHSGFQKAEQPQGSREKETEVGSKNLKSSVREQLLRFWRSDRNGVIVERAICHDMAGAGIPGIILPERKPSPRPQ